MDWLQSITAAFKGGGDTRMPLSPGYVSAWAPGFAATPSMKTFEYSGAVKSGFLANPIAQRAVRIVSEGVGQMPLQSSDEALAGLIKATSAGQSLLETLAAHLLLHGNGFVQIIKDAAGTPIELFALRPDRVSILTSQDGWPCAFEYRVGGEAIRIELEDDNGWPNLIHVKSLHPLDDLYGAGALAAANEAISIHNAASAWNRALLDNSARPSGALVYETPDGAGLTTTQFDRLKDELVSAFAGSQNSGRPMLLDGGLRWQSMSMSPADMDFATLKSAVARDIALAFGVPPMLLGLPGDNTYSNYREANRALWRLTLLPLSEKLLAAVGEGLAPWFAKAELSVDLDHVPALSEDRERLWKQVADADFLDADEKRRLLGLTEKETAP